MTRTSTIALLTGLLGLSGCGSDPEPATPDAGSDPAGPAYLLGTRVWDESTTTSYFTVVGDLAAGTAVDQSRALEVPGSAKLMAIGDIGWFAIGGGEAPTITRYSLEGDALVEGDAISLQAHGVGALWDTIYVVSETKAYYPDREGQQLIAWNPTTMEITGTIDLAQTNRDGYLSLFGYTPIVRGNQLLFSVGWFDWSANDTVLGETGLVAIDTTTDQVASFDVDTRCGGITQTIVTGSGDAYFVSSALAGAAYKLARLTTAPCALRVRADATGFDADVMVELATLTGGAIAGEPVAGVGDQLFLRVFDEAAAEIREDSATYELTGQAAWDWWSWDVATGTATKVEALTRSTADVVWFKVDGKVFGTETAADYSETTLIELTAEGGPRRQLVAPGFLHAAVRIR